MRWWLAQFMDDPAGLTDFTGAVHMQGPYATVTDASDAGRAAGVAGDRRVLIMQAVCIVFPSDEEAPEGSYFNPRKLPPLPLRPEDEWLLENLVPDV